MVGKKTTNFEVKHPIEAIALERYPVQRTEKRLCGIHF